MNAFEMVVTGGSCLPDHLLLVLLDRNNRGLFDRLDLLLLLAGSEHESNAGERKHGDGLHMMMIVIFGLMLLSNLLPKRGRHRQYRIWACVCKSKLRLRCIFAFADKQNAFTRVRERV